MSSSRRTRIRSAAAAIAAGAGLLLSGCAAGGASEPANTVSYWLWDSNQLPAYQKCAAGFEKENPGLTVKITQLGWNDYWTKLTAGFIAGTQPDVFTDHISKFAQFVDLGVLQPLDELDATKGIDDAIYQPGLADSWRDPDRPLAASRGGRLALTSLGRAVANALAQPSPTSSTLAPRIGPVRTARR